VRVDEHTTTIDQTPVFFRSAGEGRAPPIIYLHDAPGSSDDLVPFLELTGGLAPDLIGFGRSGKGGHLDYSPEGLVDFLEGFLAAQAVEEMRLVGHGWGAAIGLLLAMRAPARVERVVLIDAVPLLEGFSWYHAARLWRRPLVGELLMGSTTRRMLARHLRQGTVRTDAWTDQRLAAVWQQFDQGTQRALLRLHRAADESRLAKLGAGLGAIHAPALVVWGEQDPWFTPELADAYGRRLAAASVEPVPDAGHWPWLDQPATIKSVAEFVAQP
jgi:pimeloyl-ACP methyl ester carboxylesterase